MSVPAPATPQTTAPPTAASRVAAVAGASVATIGALVLAGWTFDIEALKSVYGPITMKTNMAVGLLTGGAGLWMLARGHGRLTVATAVTTGAIGALTLSQHVFGWDLGIDQLLFTEEAGAAATASPNRMGPNGSTSLTLAGAALLLLARGTPRTIVAAQRLALAMVLLAMLALTGYMYGAVELYGIAQYTGIALHTALALLTLSLGIIAVRAGQGPVAALTDEGPAGTLLRRLAAPVILIPFVIGYAVLRGREANFYDRGLAMALFAVAVIFVLGVMVWHTAEVIATSDERRRRAERERDDLLARERRARDQAERASRLKDQFIAVLSHELRTPLNVMLGWTRILESDAPPDRHAHAAAVVARNGRLLARLVEDLLDISRMTARQFEIARRPVSFNGIVQNAIDALGPLATQKDVRMSGMLDPALGMVHADPERLQQIVWNLLSNAVKFTPAGGTVEVRTMRQGTSAKLEVVDTGIGFDDEFASHLFEPFRQADASAGREHGGLGLGLSIAKHIAELHGGSLTGTSRGRGRGATFTLTLPAPTRDEPAAAVAKLPTAAPSHHPSASPASSRLNATT